MIETTRQQCDNMCVCAIFYTVSLNFQFKLKIAQFLGTKISCHLYNYCKKTKCIHILVLLFSSVFWLFPHLFARRIPVIAITCVIQTAILVANIFFQLNFLISFVEFYHSYQVRSLISIYIAIFSDPVHFSLLKNFIKFSYCNLFFVFF